jgi:hypothetical protein
VCSEVVTETRRGKHHVASSWRLASRQKAPWRWIPPPGLVTARGTAVCLTPSSALSPLFDPALAQVLREHYPHGVQVVAREEREVVGEIREDRFEVAFDRTRGATPGALVGRRGITPGGELVRDGFLDGLAVGEVGRAAAADADEVRLVQRQALGQRGHLDDAADVVRRGRRESEPVPATLDHLAVGADRQPTLLLGKRRGLAHEIADPRGLAAPAVKLGWIASEAVERRKERRGRRRA